MKSIIPRTGAELVLFVEVAASAAGQLADTIDLGQNTEAKIRGDLAAYLTARDAYENGKTTLEANRATVRTVTNAARDFLTVARDVQKPFFGTTYSQAWDVTGFVGSLSLPSTMAEVPGYVQAMQAYLGSNAGREVPSLNVTAARAGELYSALCLAHVTVSNQEAENGGLWSRRESALKKLTRRMRALIDELDLLLDPMDERWKAFGLNLPGAPERPELPTDVHVTLIGPTAVAVKWGAATRADYYHVWKRVIGTDQELVPAGSPADLDFTIESLPSNASVEIAVSAVNPGGESQTTEVVTIRTQ